MILFLFFISCPLLRRLKTFSCEHSTKTFRLAFFLSLSFIAKTDPHGVLQQLSFSNQKKSSSIKRSLRRLQTTVW